MRAILLEVVCPVMWAELAAVVLFVGAILLVTP